MPRRIYDISNGFSLGAKSPFKTVYACLVSLFVQPAVTVADQLNHKITRLTEILLGLHVVKLGALPVLMGKAHLLAGGAAVKFAGL